MIALLFTLLALGGTPRDTTRAAAAVARVPLDTAQLVNFRTLVQPETVYVGQQATYALCVFIDETVRDRLRRTEALPPELRGLMSYEPVATVTGFPLRVVARRRYEAHVSLRAVFPLAPGRYVIPPARLIYAMPLSYSFFSREESFELRSDSTVLVAIDPPAAGRPPEFAGAVGVLTVSATLDTAGARVGDGLHLTVRVSGPGNVKLFPRPALVVPWATAIAGAERVAISSDTITVRGWKEFDWILTPTSAGRHTLAPVRYAYFDPITRRYAVGATAPLDVTVATGTLASVDSGPATPPPAWVVRTSFRGDLPTPIYRRFWFLFLMVGLPMPALALAVAQRPRRPRRRHVVPPEQRLRELARRGAIPDVRPLRRAFLDAVALRLRASAAELAEPESLRHAARRAGTSGATAAASAAFVAELNAAAFAATRAPVSRAGERALSLYRAIDREAMRWRTPPAPAVLLLAILLAAAAARVASARPPDDAPARFEAGVTAYGDRHYAEAAREFAAVTADHPRAADAWANLGTAAFAAGDTARAVRGWQRALRLEPLAADVRERLDLIAPASATAPGAVPPVPPLPLILAAALLWAYGWIAVASHLRRHPRGGLRGTALPLTALGGALVLGIAGGFIDARLTMHGLAVARRDAPLRILPGLGAERSAVLHGGETVWVVARNGPWAEVRVDRDRDGWLPAEALLPLDDD